MPELVRALLAGMAGLAIVWLGIFGGLAFVPKQAHERQQLQFESPFGAWDGIEYAQIAETGYEFDPHERSTVVFFPGYPLLGRWLGRVFGLPVRWVLPVLSQLLFVGCVCLFWSEVRDRSVTDREAECCVWLLIVWPAGVFFRMAYSESLFLLLVLLSMRGMRRGWPKSSVAFLVGCATGVRSVGIGLAIVYWVHRWWFVPGRDRPRGTLRIVWAVPEVALSCWGFIGFLIFQEVAFGTPTAFIAAQSHWRNRGSPPLLEQFEILLSLEPIWSVYDSSSLAYWKNHELVSSPLLSLQFLNPLVFLLTCVLVYIGWKRSWLTREEGLLSCLLLAIPYVTHSYQGCMYSMARYCSVVYPAYIVPGIWLSRCRWGWRVGVLSLCALLLCVYAALFANWYRIF